MRLREHQDELKRWEEQRALGPSKPETESGVSGEELRAPRPTRGVALPPGVKQYLASLGRRGGSSRSERKKIAARANGHLAGKRRDG